MARRNLRDAERNFEELRGVVEKFRARWQLQIEAAAIDRISIETTDEKERVIYLLEDASSVLIDFARALNRIERRIKELDESEGRRARRTFTVPTLLRGCKRVEVKAYQATSVRKVTQEQARIFLLDSDVALPRGTWQYRIRSMTGFRYVLLADTDDGRKEHRLAEWAAVGCIKGFVGKRKLRIVQPRLTNELWGIKHQRELLHSRGKSSLYREQLADKDLLLPGR